MTVHFYQSTRRHIWEDISLRVTVTTITNLTCGKLLWIEVLQNFPPESRLSRNVYRTSEMYCHVTGAHCSDQFISYIAM